MAYTAGNVWTDERFDRLKALYAEGLSSSMIAAELNHEFRTGFSRNAVIGKVFRHGLEREIARPTIVRKAPPPRKPQRPRPPRYTFIKQERVVQILPQEPYAEQPSVADADISPRQRCTLFELTSKTCRWPLGDPGSPEFFFCGGPSNNDGGRPYCSYHARVAYQERPRRSAPYIPRRAA